nr:immunoglobulin heavy chain junction region [Macaca mulatta]MOY18410.1 immunoglobulin heavy chain junction region [Macaca mulatta]MOY18651.1 immunoglobulin heavy chain junction region [Macaca mulatta]MOY18842.1 immunoglobulin heavy chain junction region [Macaca mulatta]MOY19806.1 immunoglobulin heavy chain junction region [Macaca mulatta]
CARSVGYTYSWDYYALESW